MKSSIAASSNLLSSHTLPGIVPDRRQAAQIAVHGAQIVIGHVGEERPGHVGLRHELAGAKALHEIILAPSCDAPRVRIRREVRRYERHARMAVRLLRPSARKARAGV